MKSIARRLVEAGHSDLARQLVLAVTDDAYNFLAKGGLKNVDWSDPEKAREADGKFLKVILEDLKRGYWSLKNASLAFDKYGTIMDTAKKAGWDGAESGEKEANEMSKMLSNLSLKLRDYR